MSALRVSGLLSVPRIQLRPDIYRARFAQKVVDRPPVPFVDPTDGQLEVHCIEEHQPVWDELRRPD